MNGSVQPRRGATLTEAGGTGRPRAAAATPAAVNFVAEPAQQPLGARDVVEIVQARLDGVPEASRLRERTVEHVFGTLKALMGSTHFLTRTLPRVRTEMSLQVLTYNLQRVIKILGAQNLSPR